MASVFARGSKQARSYQTLTCFPAAFEPRAASSLDVSTHAGNYISLSTPHLGVRGSVSVWLVRYILIVTFYLLFHTIVQTFIGELLFPTSKQMMLQVLSQRCSAVAQAPLSAFSRRNFSSL